jgi:UDP-N-acetylglucosamine 1-carboxyvinyltransferase
VRHLGRVPRALDEIGVPRACGRDSIEVAASAIRARTRARHRDGALSGLATDLQPPTSVLLSQAHGTSRCTRRSSRTARVADELRGWARRSTSRTRTRRITGRRLQRREVEMGDLRAGASLILGALAAEGTSVIHGAHHVRRGYETSKASSSIWARRSTCLEGAGVTSR